MKRVPTAIKDIFKKAGIKPTSLKKKETALEYYEFLIKNFDSSTGYGGISSLANAAFEGKRKMSSASASRQERGSSGFVKLRENSNSRE